MHQRATGTATTTRRLSPAPAGDGAVPGSLVPARPAGPTRPRRLRPARTARPLVRTRPTRRRRPRRARPRTAAVAPGPGPGPGARAAPARMGRARTASAVRAGSPRPRPASQVTMGPAVLVIMSQPGTSLVRTAAPVRRTSRRRRRPTARAALRGRRAGPAGPGRAAAGPVAEAARNWRQRTAEDPRGLIRFMVGASYRSGASRPGMKCAIGRQAQPPAPLVVARDLRGGLAQRGETLGVRDRALRR